MHSAYDKDYYLWFTEQARLLAADDTSLAATASPEQCPFTLEQPFDEYFWPEL